MTECGTFIAVPFSFYPIEKESVVRLELIVFDRLRWINEGLKSSGSATDTKGDAKSDVGDDTGNEVISKPLMVYRVNLDTILAHFQRIICILSCPGYKL